MLDIKEYAQWLNQLFISRPIFHVFFIVNLAFNLGVLSVGIFNFMNYRNKNSAFFLFFSLGSILGTVFFSLYIFGVINIQIYYFGGHVTTLLASFALYAYLTSLSSEKKSNMFVGVAIVHFLLTLYFSISFVSPPINFQILNAINMALKLFIFGFLINIGYKVYKENLLDGVTLVLCTLFGILTVIITLPSSLIAMYHAKIIARFTHTLFNAYFIGYLRARDDKYTVQKKQEVIKLAHENQYLLLHQKKILEQTVAKRTTELEQSNTMKDKLFATIGHDLKHSVVNLKMSLTMFDKKTESNVYDMQKQVDGLYDTLDNLLEWSLLQLNNETQNSERISIKEGIGNALNFLHYNILHKNIRVLSTVEDTEIYANKHQLSIILRNIISNAIKFTPTDGLISIFTKKNDHYLELIIADTGIGISPDLLNSFLKNKHFQSRTGTAGEKGTGLGLKLCKELIENQGGTLKIESEINKGTRIKIKFLM